jgi:iron-sulfur cluster repair protein YtfE (RIC family)
MMRLEHEQMRALFPGLDAAIGQQDPERFLGLSDSLMVLIQQHNMKEEQILYPMCDQRIAAAGPLLARIQALQPDAG